MSSNNLVQVQTLGEAGEIFKGMFWVSYYSTEIQILNTKWGNFFIEV